MNPAASARAWAQPASIAIAKRWPTPVLTVLAALILSQYLAAFFFLWSVKGPVRRATPLTIARYAYYYGDREDVRLRLIGSTFGGLVVLGLSAGASLLPRRRALHGDARFATRAEVRSAGLLGSQGILLGRLGKRFLMLAGQQGVALAAPPRAGKGAGVVVPNALHWPGSFVCLDIKRENWTITAGFRALCGQACYLFDPFAEDGRTARWNPFFYVSSDPRRRVNDLQRIAEMLYPDPPNVDPFWTASARSLFLGIALYLFESPTLTKTIGEVLRQGMASDDEGFGHHWKRIIEGRHSGRFPLSPQCVRALYDVIDLAPVTASSIRKTFTSRLDLWLNPILDAATSGNDFDLRELRKTPMSIYVGVNPDDLHRLRPVLNLLFQQAIGLQTRELPERNPTLKHQVLMMLDEMTAPGRVPILAESISYLPGYNVRVVLIIHTPAQLREVYGVYNAETMLKSLAARIVFAPKDFNDAREISDELGFTTVKARTISKPLLDFLDARGRRSRSQNVSEQRRALLLPQEVKELASEEALIFYEGLRPIRCQKIRYFNDPRFQARLLPAPAAPAPGWQVEATPTAHDEEKLVDSGEAQTQAADGREGAMIGPSSPILPTQVAAAAHASQALREATAVDIERIESLTLEDYATDFSQVKIPDHAGPLSTGELQVAVESFLETLKAR